MKISVAMASYNGEKYIKEQIESVLINLSSEDELIISDDGSIDATKDIIKSFEDSRIHLIDGPKKGVKANFANAIANTTGDYIFLCDQDDIWEPDKVKKVMSVFSDSKVKVVVHDCILKDDEGKVLTESYFEYRSSGPGFFKNVMKNSYMGCCMAFTAELKAKVLPIPESIEMHDQWIGLIGDLTGRNVFISNKLIVYRRHENNVSDCFNHYGLGKMIKNRVCLLISLLVRKR